VHPQVREGLRSAIEQVFGMVLASEVEVLDSEMVPEGTDEMVATCIELPVPQQSLTLGFELLVRKDEAAGLAARMTGEAADDVTETDRDSAVAEIVNMVVGRLQNTLDERGVTSRIGLPTTEVRAARRPTAEPSDCTAIHFRCADGKPELWLHVVATADASGSQAGEDKAA